MVDARAGLMPADEAIAKHLRSRENRPSRMNKTDGLIPIRRLSISLLGISEFHPIAAHYGRGRIEPAGTCASAGWMTSRRRKRWMKIANTGTEAEQNGEEAPEDDFDPRLPIGRWRLSVARTQVVKSNNHSTVLPGEERVVVYDYATPPRQHLYPDERDERECAD